VSFSCNEQDVCVDVDATTSLLSVLREQLGVVSVKDGCAPQGQCGCCTVLVDGEPRVACVTPVGRVDGRRVTTVEGLGGATRAALADAFVASGGSQCGFCTPGIIVRAAWLLGRGKTARAGVDRALAAHLCRCTGWVTVHEAIERAAAPPPGAPVVRDLDAASRRAVLEGGSPQHVGVDVPLGHGGFADDTAPRDALVAVPLPSGSSAEFVEAAGLRFVLGESLDDARAKAGKVQGRRTTVNDAPPLASFAPQMHDGGVRLATSWVEPAYLEPDASWCAPGGEPASPLANGGAFGGKRTSVAPAAARALADAAGCTVRVVFSREDAVRLGPKRPPIAATAVLRGETIEIAGVRAGAFPAAEMPYALSVERRWDEMTVAGPPVAELRAPWAEELVLIEGAIDEAGGDRASFVRDERAAGVLLDTCALDPAGACAGARVEMSERGIVSRVEVRVAAGDPLDDVVLRSYAIGAAHMALGWVLSEGIAVDEAGEVHDLTIRSFGVIRARHVPPIDVVIVDDAGPPLPRASDAVFAAVAAATWNAVARAEGSRPESFPARTTRAGHAVRQ
jgi:aerobic-type carbon monoxide dehydrogenase small subunit (CoxS/CutS family)